jgi:flavin reductase ActVB
MSARHKAEDAAAGAGDNTVGAPMAVGTPQVRNEWTMTAERYKDLLAHLAGAIAVITTRDTVGLVWGFTASSFCSLSLDPPLVLFCLAESADCHAAFATADHFGVSILAAHQAELSQRFAMKGTGKYEDVRFVEGEMGMPLLPGALVWLECSVHTTYPGGDHTIVIGQVERGSGSVSSHAEQPLLYYDRTYGTFTKGGAQL